MLSVLEDHSDDPVVAEPRAAIFGLNEDEQIDLVTLAWLGRGDGGVEDWDEWSTLGVYAFTVLGNVQNIGRCENLSSRFNGGGGYGNISPRNCFSGGQHTNCHVNNEIYKAAVRGERISLWFFQTEDFKAVEADLLSSVALPWNKK
jgi:hypothetical protein